MFLNTYRRKGLYSLSVSIVILSLVGRSSEPICPKSSIIRPAINQALRTSAGSA